MRASLKAELESRFKSIQENKNYLTATFLDPRFKSDYLGVLETEKARQIIMIGYIKNSYDESSSDSNRLSASSTPAKRVKEEETGSNFTREVHDTIWDCFNEVAKDNSSECRDQVKQNPIANEIDFFLKTPRINRNYDPYISWLSNLTL
ncbi:ribonuclease h-like superfamily [Holotrichia oblita]|uniref:Ribonuclease h-like superfamily n=1 Tax=Holotrichia oblita TaxID=644536 RepID=A0ACB9SL11_HOLOL|nr:ribonuclease h-like superfamily [Holotrichia oblita]